jgi:hypothetical protein
MPITKNIKSLKIELDKENKKKESEKSIAYHGNNKIFSIKPQFSVAINLYIDGKKYLPDHFPKNYPYTTDVMFFASIPNRRQFSLIKNKKKYYLYLIESNFELDLTFRNNGEDVDVQIDLAFEDEPSYITMKTDDLFTQFEQMWVDLVEVLYEVYPKELVDKEMSKIYQQIDERVAKGKV